MSAAIQLIHSTPGAMPPAEAGLTPGGDVLEFIRKEPSQARAEQETLLEEENVALRRALITMQQAIMQKDALLKNARIREMELRGDLARLMC